MLTVDDYAKIRLAHRDGAGIRELSRRFGWSRQSIRKALAQGEPAGYRLRQPRVAPKLGAFVAVLEGWLTGDETVPRKQRHTAKRLYERLRAEHDYRGGYDQVRRWVQARRQRRQETFLPLVYEPGQRVECDYGHIHVDFPEGRRLVAVLLVTWAYSQHTVALALPSERTEAILHGMVTAFGEFGCVPREVWWDNPRTVATAILTGRQRRLHERYRALASHYRFEPLFCLPRRGNEKPHVENRVRRLQRRWGTPVPCCRDLAELNTHLRRQWQEELGRCISGQTETIGSRFATEAARALPLPAQPFAACVLQSARVDKYQTVRLATNRYSVPLAAAFGTVTLQVGVEEVVITRRGEVLARHRRSYGRHEQVLDPLHYLPLLERKPALWEHSAVFRSWRLSAPFTRLQEALVQRHGPQTGGRQFARVLPLLGIYPGPAVAAALAHCLERDTIDYAALAQEAARQAARLPAAPEERAAAVRELTVPRPDLSRFDQLLTQGERCHG